MGNFLSPKELGERLRVSNKTIYRWIAQEGLPAVKICGSVAERSKK